MSPAEIRACLISEEQPGFDELWRAACLAAAETLDLTDIRQTLDHYRRHVVLVRHLGGPDGYRDFLARVEERLRTGAEPTGGMSADQVQAMIARRLGITVDELNAKVAERLRERLPELGQMWAMAKYAAQATPATAQ